MTGPIQRSEQSRSRVRFAKDELGAPQGPWTSTPSAGGAIATTRLDTFAGVEWYAMPIEGERVGRDLTIARIKASAATCTVDRVNHCTS